VSNNSVHTSPQAYCNRKAGILSTAAQEGEPKHVVAGRGTFVISADENGIWPIDLEAEGWDSDVDEVLPLMRVEVF
jgi:hypothetical protein